MSRTVKYELKFRLKDGNWRLFDTYEDINDPDIKGYSEGLKRLKSFDRVKLVKIETIRTEVAINDKG